MSIMQKFKLKFSKNELLANEFKDIKSLRNMPDKYFSKGTKVRVINNKRYVRIMQQFNGGWLEEMSHCLDQVCTVIEVDHDKLIRVRTPSNSIWLFHRAVFQLDDLKFEEDCANLFNSIEEGDTERFNQLIQLEYLNVINKEGRTPINLACYLNKIDIVYFLCSFDADVTIPDNSDNLPIHTSVLNENMQIFQILAKSYPESVCKEGKRLLHIAKNKDNKMLESLISKTIRKINDEGIIPDNTKFKNFKSLLEIGIKNNRLSITNSVKTRSQSEDILTTKQNYEIKRPNQKNSNKPGSLSIGKYKVENGAPDVNNDIPNKDLLDSVETISLCDPPETLTQPEQIESESPTLGVSVFTTSYDMQFLSVPIDESIISTPLCLKIDPIKREDEIKRDHSWKDIMN